MANVVGFGFSVSNRNQEFFKPIKKGVFGLGFSQSNSNLSIIVGRKGVLGLNITPVVYWETIRRIARKG